MNQILQDIFIYLKHIAKQTSERLLKAKTGKKYLQVYLLTPILGSQLICPSTFFLPHTLNVFSLHVNSLTSVLVSDIHKEFLAYELSLIHI